MKPSRRIAVIMFLSMLQISRRTLVPLLALGLSVFVVTGCGIGPVTTSVPEQSLSLQGHVHGGNQPVSGSTIQLFEAGSTGNASQATNILTSPVSTDAYGAFQLTGKYSCASSTDQMYLTATQGNPGLGSGGNNPALVMMAVLGDCGALNANTFINVNEVTTVAAAYALAPFAGDYDHIGASSTNLTGLRNAMLNVQLLASTATGLVPTTLLSTQVIESGKLYALADALVTCVNSDGGAGCTQLFTAATPSGAATPTTVWGAVMNIVKNPGSNVGDVFDIIPPQVQFPTTLTQAPNDWTMTLTVSNTGFLSPTGVGIDSQGYVWAAGYNGQVAGFTPQGVPLTGSPYTASNFYEAFALAIDPSDNVWTVSEELPAHGSTKGSVLKFAGAQSSSPGTLLAQSSDANLDFPESIAADTNGWIDVGNYANATVTILNSDASTLYAALGSGVSPAAIYPVGIIPDANHNVWVANQSSSFATHLSLDNTVLSQPGCCAGTDGVAEDGAGNVWLSNFWNGSLSEVAQDGTVLVRQAASGGLVSPAGLTADAAGNVWVANFHGNSISGIHGSMDTTYTAGTGISPSTGFGLDASLDQPFSTAVDASGNVWVSNEYASTLVMFFGLATPTKTPLLSYRTAP